MRKSRTKTISYFENSYQTEEILKTDNFINWLKVELLLENEWKVIIISSYFIVLLLYLKHNKKKLQESTFRDLLKKKQRLGIGEKQSDVITIQPYDDNRVILQDIPIPNEKDLTFINASYVQNKNYIAAAMPSNVACERDFWRMSYEQNVQMIIMLNKPTEKDKNPYWPNKKEKIRTYGDILKVILLEETYNSDIYCYIRKFQILINLSYYGENSLLDIEDSFLSSYDFNFSEKEELNEIDKLLLKSSKSLIHIQYDDWPDMGIPDEKDVFYQFISSTFRQHTDITKKGPMVVHCFGGVGRTGTFLVIYHTIKKMIKLGGKAIKILDILSFLRSERAALVQTSEQYKFCYRIIWQFYQDRIFYKQALEGLKKQCDSIIN